MIWLPDKFYHLYPWICLSVAVIAYFLPPTIVKLLCQAYLFGYSTYIFYKRLTATGA